MALVLQVTAVPFSPPPPWKHQTDVYEASKDMPTAAYLLEQRCGKTRIVVERASYLYGINPLTCLPSNPPPDLKIDAVLVVAMPSGVPRNWLEDVGNYLPPEVPRRALVWDAGKARSKRFLAEAEELLEFDGLAWLLVNGEAILTEPFLAFLRRFVKRRRVFGVADETSLIMKAAGGKRGKKMRLFAKAKNVRPRVILDGTPVGEGPLDLYCPFAFLDPAILGHETFFTFQHHYAVIEKKTIMRFDPVLGKRVPHSFQAIAEDDEGGKQYRNLDELNERINRVSFRVLRKDCFDMPDKVYQPLYFDLSPEQRRVYDELEENLKAEIASGEVVSVQHVLTKLLRLQQVTSGYWPSSKAARACPSCKGAGEGCGDCDDGVVETIVPLKRIGKTNPRIEALVEALRKGDQAIVWTRFHQTTDDVVAAVRAAGFDPVRYDGRSSLDEKEEAKLAFQQARSNPFIGSARAGGRGLRLPARVIYYAENEYSLLTREQSEDRAEIPGMTEGTGVRDIIANGTIDENIVNALRNKRKVANAILREHIAEKRFA